MSDIPTITFQIIGPNEGVAEGSHHGLWFKVRSTPPPANDLVVGLKVRSSNGEVKQSGVIMILKHESHSADLFCRSVEGELDIWLEIEPFDALSKLEFPIFTTQPQYFNEVH
jgi:hypothetical protein